jgi:hypothetical protein
VTNRQLWRAYQALRTLANRTMPSRAIELRVARLLALVEPLAAPIAVVKTRAVLAILNEATAEPPSAIATSRVQTLVDLEQEEIDALEAPPLSLPPGILITRQDLPVKLPGAEGYENGAGAAAIINDLGPLFNWEGDDETA